MSPVSNPTKSCNRNVAVLGRPINDPVIASTSSMPKLYFSVNNVISVADITPIRFPIKAGVSLHRTVCFPSITFPNSMKKSVTPCRVSFVGIISNNLKYRAGLKKCVPQKDFLKSSERSCANKFIGILEVLELTRLPFFRYLSTFSKICFLIFKFSTTTSIIQSDSAIFWKSSSKFPVLILDAKDL